jgi:hypothetical protein
MPGLLSRLPRLTGGVVDAHDLDAVAAVDR